jgi:protein dithiol oxidoreductase (disulfide-forming)
MNHLRLIVLAMCATVIVGCGARDTGRSTTTGATSPTPEANAPTAPPSATAADAPADLKKAASTAQESAGNTEAAGDPSLGRLAALPESAELPGGRWKAGTHYTPVVPAQATSAEPGQVEVLEILWLGCPHCAELHPYLESWSSKKPSYVKFTQEHVMWGPAHRGHAKLFYALEALGKGALVNKAFDDIHRRGNILVAADDAETQRMHLAFAKANGISEANFKREYSGFSVSTRLQRAEELMRRYRVESVPLIVINGKYQTSVQMAGGHQELVQLLNDLTAFEKSR